MSIDINHERKYVDIWLAKTEDVPQFLVGDLQRQYPSYDVVVWKSGSSDLVVLTSELLRNNR